MSSGACVYIHVQGGGPADAKLTIMFTDTTHFNGFCSVPRIEKSSHFKRVARYGSSVFTLRSWALFFFPNLNQSNPIETTVVLACLLTIYNGYTKSVGSQQLRGCDKEKL